MCKRWNALVGTPSFQELCDQNGWNKYFKVWLENGVLLMCSCKLYVVSVWNNYNYIWMMPLAIVLMHLIVSINAFEKNVSKFLKWLNNFIRNVKWEGEHSLLIYPQTLPLAPGL